MGSPIIGRAACPECGFEGAHVKQSEKCLYRYCPECGAQYHAKTERQRADLTAKMRPVGGPAPAPTPTPTPTPTPEPPAPEPVPAPAVPPTPTPPTPTPATPKRRGLFAL